MLPISEDIKKLCLIKQGLTYYCLHPSLGAKPHYLIVMNRNDNGILVFLVNTTTSIEKRTNFCNENKLPNETLVPIPKGNVDFLSQDCCIDCNSVTKESKSDFIDMALGKKNYQLPKKFVDLVSIGIRKSPVVEQRIKKLV